MIRSTLLSLAVPRVGRDLAAYRFLTYDDNTETAPAIALPEGIENVADLDDDQLTDLETRAAAEFDRIAKLDRPTEADADEAERLAEIITQVQAEAGTRDDAAAERRAKIAGLIPAPEATDEDDTDDTGEAGDEVGDVEVPDDASGITDAEVPETIAASGRPTGGARTTPRRLRAAEVGSRQRKPPAPARRPVSLTAAADAPDVRPGSDFGDLLAVAEAITKRASEYPSQPFPGEQRVKMRSGIALLRKENDPGLVAKAVTDDDVLYRAADQTRLPQGSLIAAGGWCAPSETLYDLAELESADGLVDVPEITVSRGGIRFTPGPDFASIYSGVGLGFSQTEAQAIAGQTKPCYKIDCPPFQEVRAGVEGLCITNSILQNTAYPELTQRVVRGALVAHAHRISAKTIAQMVAGSTPVTAFVAQGGSVAPLLNAIELAVMDTRYKHRLPLGATLEAKFPIWVMAALRADLAWREGTEALSITDAQIRTWFTDRGVVPQFVYDWQDSGLGGVDAALAWPTEVQFLVYPAGTWVRGMGDVISLDTVYDSAGLAQNEYVGLFTEESLLVAKLGHDSRMYTVPLTANGFTGAYGNTVPGSAPVPPVTP